MRKQKLHKSMQRYMKSTMRFPNMCGFSMFEALFALLILGILGVSILRSMSALKMQNHAIQDFLLTHTSLFETQLFLNKQLSILNPQSLHIASTSITWEGYNNLFMPSTQGDYMDFSLQTTKAVLEHKNNTLYFNNALLLHGVKSMHFWLTTTKHDSILSYRICTNICLSDSILLENIIENLP